MVVVDSEHVAVVAFPYIGALIVQVVQFSHGFF